MEIRQREWEGVLTVEAALVVPAVIGCMFFLIFLAFSLHDLVVMRAAAAETVVSGFAPEEQNGPGLLYYRAYQWDRQEETAGLPICPEQRYQIWYQTAENGLMSRIVTALTGGTGTAWNSTVEGHASYVRCNPEQFIWMCQILFQDTEEQADTEEQTDSEVSKETLKDLDGR